MANKGRYMVKKCQKHVYVICEGSLKPLCALSNLVAQTCDEAYMKDELAPL